MAAPRWTVNGVGWLGVAISAAVLVAAIAPFAPLILRRASDVSFSGPDWALAARLSWIVQMHIFAALSALAIGIVIMLRPKGRGLHTALGWSWVVAMATTAISSLWITDLNGSFWSFVHLLSGWTIVALPMAIFAIRNRKVEQHRRAMTGMFVGGLLVAGALTFIPGRFMFEFFFN